MPDKALCLRYVYPETLEQVETDRYSKILIQFNQIQDVELHDFNERNVISCMVFEKVNDDIIQVTLPSIYGLGGSFKCKSVDVVELEALSEDIYKRPTKKNI